MVALPVIAFLVFPAIILMAGVAGLLLAKTVAARAVAGVLAAAGALALVTVLLALAGPVRDPMPFLFMLPLVVVGVLALFFWVWMLADCALNEPDQGNEKLVWVVIIIFTQVIGAAIYYFARRPQRIAVLGR